MTYGLDGTFYKDEKERMRADARFKQQRDQNKLLEEQNKLLKEQQKERNRVLEEQNRLIKEQNIPIIEESSQRSFDEDFAELEKKDKEGTLEPQYRKIYEEMKKLKEEQKNIDRFKEDCINFIYPIMEDAGIKNPVAYLDKLYELYEENKPKEKELEMLNEENYITIIENKLQQYPSEIQNEIQSLKLNKSSSKIILMGFILSGIIALIGFLIESEIVLISAMLPLSICGFIGSISGKSKKAKTKFEQEIKEKIKLINSKIEIYNSSVKEKKKEWESKIRNYESKRIKDFNFLLEIALDKYSMLSMPIFGEENSDYRLHFNSYPDDWKEKKEEFYKGISREKAILDGTEIFEDL